MSADALSPSAPECCDRHPALETRPRAHWLDADGPLPFQGTHGHRKLAWVSRPGIMDATPLAFRIGYRAPKSAPLQGPRARPTDWARCPSSASL